jgi:hypothetical protein
MKTVTFTIRGLSPLLMNSASAFTHADEGGPKTRKIPTPEEEAQSGLYMVGEGLGFIASAFRKAIVVAAKGRRVGRMGLPGIVQSAVFETVEHVTLVDPDTGKQLTEYEIDIRGARPPGQGMVRRARPLIPKWQCDIDFEYDEELVTPEIIGDLLKAAGMRVGVGNFRPEKAGRFGRFEVVGQS